MPPEAPSSSRVPVEERLFSLVLALIATENGLTKTEILSTVQGYRQRFAASTDRAALERQFERDKDDVRDLGIPVETIDPEGEQGNNQGTRYRIPKGDYDLPADITFSPDEIALLRLAGTVWREGSLAAESRRAIVKLRSLGIAPDEPVTGFAPRVRVRDAAFDPLSAALDRSLVVTFDYLKPGEAAPRRRRVEPRALVQHLGRWHLHGWDRDADGTRTFLLSRIVGSVSLTTTTFERDDVDHAAHALAELDGILLSNTATIEVAPATDAALRLARRYALDTVGGTVELHYTDVNILADELASFGPEVVVRSPERLRDAVVARLRRALADHTDDGGVDGRVTGSDRGIDGLGSGGARG